MISGDAEEPLDDASDPQKRRPKIPPKLETNTLISKVERKKAKVVGWLMIVEGVLMMLMEMKDGEERERERQEEGGCSSAGARILL